MAVPPAQNARRKEVPRLKKKLIPMLLAAWMLCVPSVTASAAVKTTVADQIIVTGYNAKTDYTALMMAALEDGSPYALQMGAIYERQRNLKIDDMRLTQYKKTYFFTDYNTVEDIREAMKGKPKPSYTEEDLDLLARIINAEAGCDWIPDWVQRMVGSVVLNRVKSKYFPNTIREVIYQPGQYGPVYNGSINKKPSQRVINNAKYILENGGNCPENVTGQSGSITGGGLYKSYYDRILGTTIYFCYT